MSEQASNSSFQEAGSVASGGYYAIPPEEDSGEVLQKIQNYMKTLNREDLPEFMKEEDFDFKKLTKIATQLAAEVDRSEETEEQQGPEAKKRKELIPAEWMELAKSLFGNQMPEGAGVEIFQRLMEGKGEVRSETPMVLSARQRQLLQSNQVGGQVGSAVDSLGYDDYPDLLVDGVVFIAVMTDLSNEVAKVLRAILAGEAKLRGDTLKQIVSTGLDAAQARLNAGFAEADSLREDAKIAFTQGVTSILSGAVQIGITTGTLYMTNKSNDLLKADADQKAIDLARQKYGDNVYNEQGALKADRPISQEGAAGKPDLPKQIDRNTISHNGEYTPEELRPINEIKNEIQTNRANNFQISNAYSQGISSVINGIGSIAQGFFTLNKVEFAEIRAIESSQAEIFNLISQILDKVYNTSAEQANKVFQMLQDFVRQLEQLAQTINQFGRFR